MHLRDLVALPPVRAAALAAFLLADLVLVGARVRHPLALPSLNDAGLVGTAALSWWLMGPLRARATTAALVLVLALLPLPLALLPAAAIAFAVSGRLGPFARGRWVIARSGLGFPLVADDSDRL